MNERINPDIAGSPTRPRQPADGTLPTSTRILSCPACDRATPTSLLYAKNGCDILRCSECGLGRAQADNFDPAAYYDAEYFSGGRPDGYLDYRGAEPVLRREFARTVGFIRQFVSRGRLLELGCAYGFFLKEAQRYFDVTGIELAADAAAFARRAGLRVFAGAADERLLAKLGGFDVIALLDVIEHLPEPRDTLSLCARYLNPGGIIVLTTGDFGALSARIAGSRWRLMTPPQHSWFFTRESLRRMAASLGLRLEHCDHPWKVVSLSLISFQLARMLGSRRPVLPATSRIGIPINLFDAMRLVLRKPTI